MAKVTKLWRPSMKIVRGLQREIAEEREKFSALHSQFGELRNEHARERKALRDAVARLEWTIDSERMHHLGALTEAMKRGNLWERLVAVFVP